LSERKILLKRIVYHSNVNLCPSSSIAYRLHNCDAFHSLSILANMSGEPAYVPPESNINEPVNQVNACDTPVTGATWSISSWVEMMKIQSVHKCLSMMDLKILLA
jgi:hypothetical protein